MPPLQSVLGVYWLSSPAEVKLASGISMFEGVH